jgi:outer membrane lipoprotein-sorting protein
MSISRRGFLTVIPVGALAASLPTIAAAQDAPAARELAEAVRSYHQARRTVQARFAQHFWHHVYRRTQTSRGRLAVQRPDQVRFDYDPPSSKIFVSRGEHWIMYEPVDGGPGQYTRGSTATASSTAISFLTGTVDLDRYRCSTPAPSATDPAGTFALQLVPLRADPRERRIVLHVDGAADAPRIVRRIRVEDADRNANRFDLDELSFDVALDPSTFRFTPPEGAREIRG